MIENLASTVLTRDESADVLKCSKFKIDQLIRDGATGAVKLGRLVRIPDQSIRRVLTAGSATGGAL